MTIAAGELILASDINNIKSTLDLACDNAGTSRITGWSDKSPTGIIYASEINVLIGKFNQLVPVYEGTVSGLTTISTVSIGEVIYAALFNQLNSKLSEMSTASLIDDIEIDMAQIMDERTTLGLSCTANYSNNSTEDVTQDATWSIISGSQYANLDLTNYNLIAEPVVGNQTVVLRAEYNAYGETYDTQVTIIINEAVKDLVSITLTPQTPSIAIGQTQQFTLMGTYDDTSMQDITNDGAWSITGDALGHNITTTGLLTISTSGSTGTITISSSYQTFTETTNVTVTEAVAEDIAFTFPTGDYYVGQEKQLTAIATMSDGSTVDITNSGEVIWAVSNSNIAHFSTTTPGLLIIDGAGTFTVSATYDNVTKTSSSVTTLADNVESIVLQGPASLDENTSYTYTVQGTYSSGTTETLAANLLTFLITSGASYGTVNTSGTVTTTGVTTQRSMVLYAELKSDTTVSDTQTISVLNSERILSSIAISGAVDITEQTQETYTCTATYDDDSTQTVTPSWSVTSGSSYASINSSGVLSANDVSSNQNISISATYTEAGVTKSDTHNVTIIALPDLSSVTISGPTNVAENDTAQYSLTATYSDSSQIPISATSVTWSDDSMYAWVDTFGVLTPSNISADQPVTVTASYTEGGITKTDYHNLTINVVRALSSISITGPGSLQEDETITLSCTADYDDGYTEDITSSATWNMSPSTVATFNSSTGVFDPISITSDTSVTVTASYTFEGVTKTDSHTVNITIINDPRAEYGTPLNTYIDLMDVQQGSVIGTDILLDNSIPGNNVDGYCLKIMYSYNDPSYYDMGYSAEGTLYAYPYANASWAVEKSDSAVTFQHDRVQVIIDNGQWRIGYIGEQYGSINIKLHFTSNVDDITNNYKIIDNVNTKPDSISISGPATIDIGQSQSYTATAHTGGTTKDITQFVAWYTWDTSGNISIDEYGNVTATAAGTYSIRAGVEVGDTISDFVDTSFSINVVGVQSTTIYQRTYDDISFVDPLLGATTLHEPFVNGGRNKGSEIFITFTNWEPTTDEKYVHRFDFLSGNEIFTAYRGSATYISSNDTNYQELLYIPKNDFLIKPGYRRVGFVQYNNTEVTSYEHVDLHVTGEDHMCRVCNVNDTHILSTYDRGIALIGHLYDGTSPYIVDQYSVGYPGYSVFYNNGYAYLYSYSTFYSFNVDSVAGNISYIGQLSVTGGGTSDRILGIVSNYLVALQYGELLSLRIAVDGGLLMDKRISSISGYHMELYNQYLFDSSSNTVHVYELYVGGSGLEATHVGSFNFPRNASYSLSGVFEYNSNIYVIGMDTNGAIAIVQVDIQ